MVLLFSTYFNLLNDQLQVYNYISLCPSDFRSFGLHILCCGQLYLSFSSGSSMHVFLYGKHFSHLVVYYYTFDNVVFVVAILSLPLHFYSYVLSYFFILIIHFLFSVSFFCRWPYPFLDLSSPYAPLWYGVIIYLIITIANTTIILEPPYSVQKHAFNSQHEKTSLFSKNIDKRKVLKKSYILPIGHLCLQNAINFPQ